MPQPITADCLAKVEGIKHGFFTRAGGVSKGIYASLNCGIGSRDTREDVLENRARVAGYLSTSGDKLLTCHQVHSNRVAFVEKPFGLSELPKADALVTREPGLALGALAADCAPVLFVDPEARVIGAAHAGWKGAFDDVLKMTVLAMCLRGASKRRIRAALGPCIGRDAYEVGPEFEERFLVKDPGNNRFFHRPSESARPHFDLPAFVLSRLERLELDTIEDASQCTYSNDSTLFSYRRATHKGEPDYGRQVAAIALL
ncbi:MAG: peptidoglycan editing factor PgeF [Hyphomicrobiaceae bacterium]